VKVSVAICTWNRAKLLDETLLTMRALDVPPNVEWEVIVVDNNSADETSRVLDRHASHLPLVALFEPQAGKSYAANLAASRADGDLLIWTDDDVRVAAGWLSAYVDAARRSPEAAFFAGPIDPWFETPPPPWIDRHLSSLTGVYVIVDHGPDYRRLAHDEAVFGANMAFRTDVARAFPLNERLGRIRGSLIGGDDTELIKRVHDAGFHGVWVPAARVQHFVPTERLTKHYVKRWFTDAGRNFVRQGGLLAPHRTVRGVPTWVARELVQSEARRCFALMADRPRWFAHFRRSMMLRGVIREALYTATAPE